VEIDLTEQEIVGGYRRVTKDKAVVLVKTKKHKLIGGYQIRGEHAGYIGALRHLFMERYNAVEEGEEFRWRNTRFLKLPSEEVWKLVLDGPYKHAMF
jgi:hypothetical protein